MQPLEKSLRNKLEKTIKNARDIAEDAARAAFEQLGVGEPTAYPHLTETDRVLRRKFRAHGRQLGNGRNAKGEQALDRLIEEVAYEHWHRMLFARFLAENNLLMYPDPDDPVAVTLEECEDLAADEGASNGWELASRYAARMLPQIFRPDSPVFQLMLPPEHQQKLERLIADLSQEVFTASDSLGWVYQFWQAKKKDEINASEVKIGARELPAVTQLFTEPYMVSFLLDNSLGAWWAARRLSDADLKNATSEDELRNKTAIPGVPLEYLRFVQQEDGTWSPAAGTFDSWPESLSELKTLDPCCGSGHFLVAAFLMLVPMRMELEGLTDREAVDAVLRENIHGLEIDQRCVELAAFALALTAWRYPGAGGYGKLPELNVACSGLSISANKDEWLAMAGDNTNLRLALEELYKQFKNAPVLGSLINPETSLDKGSLFEFKWEEVGPLLVKAISGEMDEEKFEMGVVAKGVVESAHLLANKYHLVVTNVPYLTTKKQSQILQDYIKVVYHVGRHDLATTFLLRSSAFLNKGGSLGIVIPQNWMALSSYKNLRKNILKSNSINLIARLGAGAFQTQMWDFNVSLCLLSNTSKINENLISNIDVSEQKVVNDKSDQISKKLITAVRQTDQLNNPDCVLTANKINTHNLLDKYAICPRGVVSGDGCRWTQQFWEQAVINTEWRFFQGSISSSALYSGRDKIINWSTSGEGMLRPGRDNLALNKMGVSVSLIGALPVTIFTGELYDQTTASIIPNAQNNLIGLYCFCISEEFNLQIREIDQKLNITPATLLKVSFNEKHWSKVAEEKYPNGLPKHYSDNPTQWIFHGHPAQSDSPLQVAVARLLGYRWPAETDPDMELSEESCSWVKKSQELLRFSDADGIACILAVRGEMKAEDRIENLLAAAYGSEWSSNKKAELLAQAGHAGKTLDTWLRDKFFIQHCKLFQHRPFIWHIWDGLHDGFAALVNYHKLDAKLLETLIYNYLGDWIIRQKQDIGNSVDGAQEKLAAAEALKKKLELILEGEGYPDKENPEKSYGYDIFVRWKPIEGQPIGWHPDLNDGVRLNIRPFMTVPDVQKKGAGVLRDKPNIKWGKDRGKDVESAPWYPLFKGDRINDHHLSLEEKRKAQQQRR